MVERWHQRLKDALRAAADNFSWVDRLLLIIQNLHVALRDDGRPSPAEIVYATSLSLPIDLVTKSTEHIIHSTLDYSHRLKAHIHNVHPIERRHKVAHSMNYHLDQALQTAKKILLRRINYTDLQDNYEGPFDVNARSEKYFPICLDNGRIDNVTIDLVKPCFTQSGALSQPCCTHAA